MGFWDDFANVLNSVANYKKADAEQIKAKTQKDKMKNLRKQNRELKKAISKGQKMGIIGIIATFASVFIGYYLLVYFPIHSS